LGSLGSGVTARTTGHESDAGASLGIFSCLPISGPGATRRKIVVGYNAADNVTSVLIQIVDDCQNIIYIFPPSRAPGMGNVRREMPRRLDSRFPALNMGQAGQVGAY
jgi:hypothetical protein